MSTGVISYPVPPYSNPPIEPQFYQPSRFVISGITTGQTTIVQTTVNQNYVVGQLVRLLIPTIFGSYQLNNVEGYVISIPTANSVEIDIVSTDVNAFIPSPYTATITNITQSLPVVITASNSFLSGNILIIYGVSGMTEINGITAAILSRTSTTITLNLDTSTFSAYSSGGVAALSNVPQTQAQIMATGDINTGVTNTSGRVNNITYIPGSFINISPN